MQSALMRLGVAVMAAVMLLDDLVTDRTEVASERGEISSTTITIAILAALAIAVGAIITMKITGKANAIPTT